MFVTDGDLVPLRCSRQTLDAIAGGLSRFGPAAGEPDWLVSGVWLCTENVDYLATSFTVVLADGYVARTLTIHTPSDLARTIEADIDDIEDRLRGRGNNSSLPRPCSDFGPPQSLQSWNAHPMCVKVLIRIAERLLATHRVACALLFKGEDGRLLLVGTDTASLAMVVSEDKALIGRYLAGCEEIDAEDFSDFG